MPSHRAEKIDTATKIPKLREFIDPVKAGWQTESIQTSLRSYSGFCELLALDKVQAYLASRHVHEVLDWGSWTLDEEGLALQSELEERQRVRPHANYRTNIRYADIFDRLFPFDQRSHFSLSLWRDLVGPLKRFKPRLRSGRMVSLASLLIF